MARKVARSLREPNFFVKHWYLTEKDTGPLHIFHMILHRSSPLLDAEVSFDGYRLDSRTFY